MHKMINGIFNRVVYAMGSLRAFFWSLFLKKMGKHVYIMDGVTILSPQNVEIGHDVILNGNTKIHGQRGVRIGNYVLIGYNVNIASHNHAYQNSGLPITKQGYFGGPIDIENDVWIGANAVILPNVKVGRGAVIGANAVVTKNVRSYTIVGGVPARFNKYRFSKQEIEKAKRVDLF